MVTRAQKILLGLIAALLALPLPLMLALRDRPLRPGSAWGWVANRSLHGMTLPAKTAATLKLKSWLSGRYQRGCTAWFNENFAGREAFIRANNQILWSLFGRSYMLQGNILRGHRGQLFGADYVKYQAGWATPVAEDYLDDLAIKARQVQERLRARGVAFAVFITPSKAPFFAEDIPRIFPPPRGGSAPPRQADDLLAALQRRNVPAVDGRASVRLRQQELPGPAFPRTGLHWSHPAAAFAAADLLRELGAQGLSQLPRLAVERVRVTDAPGQADDDLALLLNLLAKPTGRYLCADYSAVPAGQGGITFVGGSFLHTVNEVLDEARAFARIRHYHYFKVPVQTFPGGQTEPVDEARIAWEEDFLGASAVVLEINEIVVPGRHPAAFLNAVLASLPDSPGRAAEPVRASFLDKSRPEGGQAAEARRVWCRGNAATAVTNAPDRPRAARLRLPLAAKARRLSGLCAPDDRSPRAEWFTRAGTQRVLAATQAALRAPWAHRVYPVAVAGALATGR